MNIYHITLSIGAYTDSAGLSVVKQDISEYITRRDGGVPCNPSDIYLTTGASGGIKVIENKSYFEIINFNYFF